MMNGMELVNLNAAKTIDHHQANLQIVFWPVVDVRLFCVNIGRTLFFFFGGGRCSVLPNRFASKQRSNFTFFFLFPPQADDFYFGHNQLRPAMF